MEQQETIRHEASLIYNETSGVTTQPSKNADTRPGELEERIAEGLRFSNMLGFANQGDIGEMKALVQTLVELLIAKGFIHLNEIEQRKASIAESLNTADDHRPQIHLVDTPDKYAQGDVVNLDCASRYPVCRGACCRLWFALSIQDLDERIVRWNYACPYGIAQGKDGRCVHQDRSSFRCTIYENRPLICRSYDCRQDQRIWLDFDKGVVNPDILKGD